MAKKRSKLQKTSSKAMSTAMPLLLVVGYVFYLILPEFVSDSTGTDLLIEKLAYAIKCNTFPVLILSVMFYTLAFSRYFHDHLNEILKFKEDDIFIRNRRAYENSMEQTFLFSLTTLAMATVLDANQMKAIGIMTGVFCVSRIMYWVIYRIDPIYRAPAVALGSIYAPAAFYVLYRLLVS